MQINVYFFRGFSSEAVRVFIHSEFACGVMIMVQRWLLFFAAALLSRLIYFAASGKSERMPYNNVRHKLSWVYFITLQILTYTNNYLRGDMCIKRIKLNTPHSDSICGILLFIIVPDLQN